MKTIPVLAIALTLSAIQSARADYPTVVIADSPAAYYRFEEAAGATTLVDSSGNGLDATDLVNAILGGAGAVGNALQLNGDGSILTPLMLDPSVGDFTLEAIVNPGAIIPAGGVYLSNQDGTGLGRSNLLVNGDYNLNSFVGGATTSAGPIAVEGTWYHIILTYDQSAVAGGVDPTLRFIANLGAEIHP